jgi:hypothetical protein
MNTEILKTCIGIAMLCLVPGVLWLIAKLGMEEGFIKQLQ